MDPVEALREALAEKGKVLVVVGSGVSVAATGGAPCASWPGLLEDGVRACEARRHDLPKNWGQRRREDLASGDLSEMLGVAHQVVEKLGGIGGDEFRDWLKSSVGTLRVKHPELIEAIWALGAPIATTNYDDLLFHGHEKEKPWTWLQHAQILDWAHRNRSGIFHAHGHWDSPESVVLDPRSYERNLQDDQAQAVLEALGAMTSFLYIGCGEGLADPHFESFRDWLKSRFGGTGFFHYRLCLKKEAAELEKTHFGEGMRVVSYGKAYGELAPFLHSLAPGTSVLAPSPPPAASVVLPGRPICFGRTSEVEKLVAAFLAQPPKPVVIVGGAGMGKSTITLEALHDPRIRERFGKRRFFVRCDGAKGREALAQEIARTLALVPQGNAPIENQICNWLEASPALLVLDNAETPWEVPEETLQVEELFGVLASVPELAFVVSLRGEQFPGGVLWREKIRVGPLSSDAARRVFQEIAGSDFTGEEKDLDLLLGKLDYWALPITLLAHRAQSEPDLSSLRKRWEKQRSRFLQRAGGNDKAVSLIASLELSYDSPRLNQAARRLLSLLGVLPDGISPEDLPALLPEDADDAAGCLRQAGLVRRADSRLRVLAPVREWIAEAHPPVPADLDRTIDHFVDLAGLGDQVGREGGAEASARLLADLRNLEVMVMTGLKRPDIGPGIIAACDLANFFRLTGWGTSRLIHMACETARKSGDLQGEADCLKSLGILAFHRSENEEARESWEQAQAIYQNIGNQMGEAICLRRLGDLAFWRYQNEEAREHWEQARALYQNVHDQMGEANCLKSLGDLAFRRSENEEARESWEQARTLYQNVDGQIGEANCLRSLGDLAFRRFEDEEARESWEQARAIYQNVGNQMGEANCLLNLGSMLQSSKEDPRPLFEQALSLYQQVQNPYSIALAHRRLARISEEPERSRHVRTARELWAAQDLPNLVEELNREFGPEE